MKTLHNKILNLYPFDCEDTLNGVCVKVSNLKECESMVTDYGYYDKKRKICAPMYPRYKYLSTNDYSTNKNIDSIINTKKYPLFPDMANCVIYKDMMSIYVNLQNKQKFITNSFSLSDSIESGIIIKLFSYDFYRTNQPIKYGDKFYINFAGTNQIASLSTENNLMIEWDIQDSQNNFFTFESYKGVKKIGDLVSYKDKFYIKYLGNKYLTPKDNKIILSNTPTDYFMFRCNETGFYMNGDTCMSVKMYEAVDSNDIHGVYMGHKLSRVKCVSKHKKKLTPFLFISFFFSLFLLYICLV